MIVFRYLISLGSLLLALWASIVPAMAQTTEGQGRAASVTQLLDSASRYDKAGKTAEAIRVYEHLANNEQVDSASKLVAFKKLVNLYGIVGDVESTTQWLKKLQTWASDSMLIAQSNLQLAQLLMQTKDYAMANVMLERAFRYFEHQGNYMWMAKVKGFEALAAKFEGNTTLAQEKGNQAWQFIQAHKKTGASCNDAEVADIECGILNNSADLLISIGEFRAALAVLDKTAPLLDHIREYTKAGILISYGEVYAGLGDLEAAKSWYRKGIAVAESGHYQTIKEVAYKELAKLLKKEGKHKEALAYFEQYVATSQEMLSRKNIQELNYVRTQYTMEKKDKEIAEGEVKLLKKSRELAVHQKQQLVLIGGSLSLLIIVALLYRNARNKALMLQAEKAVMEAEGILKGERQERSRIAKELHDSVVSEMTVLKLHLETLYMNGRTDTVVEEIKKAVVYAGEVLEKLRSTAHNMMPENIEGGLDLQLRHFIGRLPHTRIAFDYQVVGAPTTLPPLKEKIISMIVRELVNNIIKHSKATQALVQLNFFAKVLTITVEDNGTGLDMDKARRPETMGWKNVQENLRLLGAVLDIQASADKGTTVFIEIPL